MLTKQDKPNNIVTIWNFKANLQICTVQITKIYEQYIVPISHIDTNNLPLFSIFISKYKVELLVGGGLVERDDVGEHVDVAKALPVRQNQSDSLSIYIVELDKDSTF